MSKCHRSRKKARRYRYKTQRGDQYTLTLKRPPRSYRRYFRSELCGVCDFERNKIWVDPNQSRKDVVDTVVHEMLHSFWPGKSERVISHCATAIAEALKTLTR